MQQITFPMRIKAAWRALTASPPQPRAVREPPRNFTRNFNRRYGQEWKYTSILREGFEGNEHIHTGTKEWADACASVPMTLYEGDRQNMQPVLSHPIQDVLERPNSDMTGSVLQGLQQANYRVLGECFLWADRGPDGTATALYNLPPQRVVLEFAEKDLRAVRYIPTGEGDGFLLNPDDVLHLKQVNLRDPFDGLGRGLSPLVPLALTGAIDNNLKIYMHDFIQSGLPPAGFFKTDAHITPDNRDVIEQEFFMYVTGAGNGGLPRVMHEDWEWVPTDVQDESLVMEQVQRYVEGRIHQVMQIPAILLGATYSSESNAKYSNVEIARRQWWENKVLQWLREYAAGLQRLVVPPAMRDRFFVKPDVSGVAVLREDEARLHTIAQGWVDRGVPLNEAMAAVGLTFKFSQPSPPPPEPEREEEEEQEDDDPDLPDPDPLNDGQRAMFAAYIDQGVDWVRDRAISQGRTAHRDDLLDYFSRHDISLPFASLLRAEALAWVPEEGVHADRYRAPLQDYVDHVASWGPPILVWHQRNRDDWRRSVNSVIRGIYTGAFSISTAVATLQVGIQRNYTRAWLAGSGTSSVADMSRKERAVLDGEIREDQGYVRGFVDRLARLREAGESQTRLMREGEQWRLAYDRILALAKTYDREDPRLQWLLGNTEDHCKTCEGLHKRTYRASKWAEHNCYPKSKRLECGGGNYCDCSLEETNRLITPGRFPTTLLRSHQHEHTSHVPVLRAG